MQYVHVYTLLLLCIIYLYDCVTFTWTIYMIMYAQNFKLKNVMPPPTGHDTLCEYSV